MTDRFAGANAVVTGGGSGIGRAVCERLAAEGAFVVAADLDMDAASETVALVQGQGGTARAQVCDVGRPSDVESLFDADSPVCILVTCAGITRDDPIHKMALKDWQAVIDTHLTGSFLCAQAAQRSMVSSGGGRIVFFSSGAARGNRGQANYSAAKGGIESLTWTLALELGRFRIGVNAVAPGFVDTPMARRAAERAGVGWDAFREDVERSIPLGSMATPTDIAGVVAFLCGPDAAHVTGQVISVRGGP